MCERKMNVSCCFKFPSYKRKQKREKKESTREREGGERERERKLSVYSCVSIGGS
jgi:hypothetical protein